MHSTSMSKSADVDWTSSLPPASDLPIEPGNRICESVKRDAYSPSKRAFSPECSEDVGWLTYNHVTIGV